MCAHCARYGTDGPIARQLPWSAQTAETGVRKHADETILDLQGRQRCSCRPEVRHLEAAMFVARWFAARWRAARGNTNAILCVPRYYQGAVRAADSAKNEAGGIARDRVKACAGLTSTGGGVEARALRAERPTIPTASSVGSTPNDNAELVLTEDDELPLLLDRQRAELALYDRPLQMDLAKCILP